ncbi:Nn.00g088530.m01.CDS01 [Neocucurbitaria sp. VM-36]
MSGFTPNPSSKRDPAVFVGGQRRRLVRRSNLPRSDTSPALSPESNTTRVVSSVSGVATSSNTADREDSNSTISRAPSAMNLYPPTGGIPTDFRPPTKSHPSNSSSTSIPATDSPIPTTPGEGKKKHTLFDGMKAKDRDRPGSSHASPLATSPLPPTTPSKAAQFLGLEEPTFGSPRQHLSQYEDVHHGVPVRPVLQKQSSMPLLTKMKDVTTSRQTKFKEEGVEPDPPKSKKFHWGGSNKKAMKMLDLLPSLGSGSKRAKSHEHAAASPSLNPAEDDTKIGYSSDTDLHARPFKIPAAPRSISERRMRKKGPKSLDRMSPITENSYDELGAAYRNSEHITELDVISEYEDHHPSYNTARLPQLHTEPMLTTNTRYELDEDELSSTDGIIDEEAFEEDKQMIHPGTQVKTNCEKWQQPAVVHKRGPLQTIEDRFLDATEIDLEARRAELNRIDAARLKMDMETGTLKASHEKMQKDFQAMKQRAIVHEEDEDDGDAVLHRTGYDLEEEPTVHTAEVMTFTRITPGMVKLVDIPPRKNKLKSPVNPGASAEVKPTERKSPYFFEHDDDISPFNERSENISPKLDSEYLEAHKYSRLTKAKKEKMPRDESRLLVQDWITSSPRPAEQRPVSERIDLDVLADQQIPPAPFPKEERK